MMVDGLIMKKKLVAVFSFLALVAARGADLSTTYHFAPALQNEANPLVKFAGLGWSGLLTSQMIALLVNGVGLWFYAFGRTKHLPGAVQDGWRFASLCLYDRPLSRLQFLTAILISRPRCKKDWYQHGRLLGLVVPWAVIVGSGFCTLGWWLIHYFQIQWFKRFYFLIELGSYPLSLIIIALMAATAATVFFFVTEAKQANREHPASCDFDHDER
jgi:hypothetical protein